MSTSASPKAKRAHDDSLAAEEYTVQKKKQARALTLCNNDGGLHEVAGNEYDGAEVDATDDSAEAFAAFVAVHKIELGIFRSVEWATVLAAAEEARYNEPIVLLARAPIHLSNRQVVEDGPGASSDGGTLVGGAVCDE